MSRPQFRSQKKEEKDGRKSIDILGGFCFDDHRGGVRGPFSEAAGNLYERLGGKEAIAAVVNDFVDKVGQDPRVRHLPAPERVAPLKVSLADLVCQASGGPCIYRGKEMKAAHAGMGISNAEFDAVVDDLVQTINKYKVGEREKNELLSLLAPMRTQIVEAP